MKTNTQYLRLLLLYTYYTCLKLLEIRRDPRGQQKRSLKTFRKRTVSLRDSRETNHRRKSDISVENQTLRELLDKVIIRITNYFGLYYY